LDRRLQEVIQGLVSPYQSIFIPNRQSVDNVIIVQEVFHSIKTKKGNCWWMEIKIDLEKAYSRFSWVHIKETLLDIGLSHNLVELILWCTSSSKIRVLWNGEALGEFKPTRGIHQDYPMSSYLFLLCIER